jgi:hypothetical protein
VTNGPKFTDADLSHVPNVGPWFAEFIEQRTTAAAEHVAGCHDERCEFCHGGDSTPLGLVEHVSRQEFPDLSITRPDDEPEPEPTYTVVIYPLDPGQGWTCSGTRHRGEWIATPAVGLFMALLAEPLHEHGAIVVREASYVCDDCRAIIQRDIDAEKTIDAAPEGDDEPDRDTADEQEGADELARETWHPTD